MGQFSTGTCELDGTYARAQFHGELDLVGHGPAMLKSLPPNNPKLKNCNEKLGPIGTVNALVDMQQVSGSLIHLAQFCHRVLLEMMLISMSCIKILQVFF